MTTTLQLTTLLVAVAGGECLGRILVQLILTYLALRGSTPAERAALLQALGPTIAAGGSPLP